MFKICLVICVFLFAFNANSQTDTSKNKTPEIDIYNNACKLIDSSKYKESIVYCHGPVMIHDGSVVGN